VATSLGLVFFADATKVLAGLRAEGGERLGEFRNRVAETLDVLAHNVKLTTSDGVLLAEEKDGQDLKALLVQPLFETRSASS